MWEITDKDFDRIEKEFPFQSGICPTCGSTEDTPPTERVYQHNGKQHPCSCANQKTAARYYYAANIPRRFHSLSLRDMDKNYKADVEGAVQHYLDNFEFIYHYGKGLCFHGTQGTGKTLAATHILKELIKRGYRGYFIQWSELFNSWASSWKDAASKELVERNLKRAQVLVLDDITSDGRNSEGFLQAGLEAVFRHRYNNSLPTILTTNMTNSDIEVEFPRAYSLISGVTDWVTFRGRDYRPQHNSNIDNLIEHHEKSPVV